MSFYICIYVCILVLPQRLRGHFAAKDLDTSKQCQNIHICTCSSMPRLESLRSFSKSKSALALSEPASRQAGSHSTKHHMAWKADFIDLYFGRFSQPYDPSWHSMSKMVSISIQWPIDFSSKLHFSVTLRQRCF